MANTKAVDAYSTTVASNETSDASQSNFPTNLLAGSYKTKLWGLKATLKASWADVFYGTVTGGTATAYTITQNRSLDSFIDGMVTTFIPDANCGANPTLSVSSLAATPIKYQDGGAIAADALVAGIAYTVRYNATAEEWRLTGTTAFEVAADITAAIATALSGSIASAISAAITASLGAAVDVWTGTTNKSLTGGSLVDALAAVSVTMDNAMELDLALGRNFKASATLNTNSTISLANVKATVFVFTFTCDGSARTLTFPSGSVTEGGFATLTKAFSASQTHRATCLVADTGVYDWVFRSNIKAAA